MSGRRASLYRPSYWSSEVRQGLSSISLFTRSQKPSHAKLNAADDAWHRVAPAAMLDDVLKADAGGNSMFHLIWYVLIGLISGVIAKSVMHVHITIFWTIVLGIIGSIVGGGITHMFSRPANERYHPAGLIFSTLGAILVLYICYKLKIHFPQV